MLHRNLRLARLTPSGSLFTSILGLTILAFLTSGMVASQTAIQTPSFKIAQTEKSRLFMGLHTVGRFQALDHSDVFSSGDEIASIPAGFQTAWGSVDFLADFDNAIQVYFELYLSSRPHSSTVYGHQGYLLVKDVPENLRSDFLTRIFKTIDIKVGHFEIDFGDYRYRRSDNARTQRNALIGNTVIDPKTVEIGGELSVSTGPVTTMFGVGSGSTTEKFKNGTGISLHGKVSADVTPDITTSASFYRVDHSGNAVKFAGSWGNLFSGNRSGGPYSGVLAGGNAPGQVTPGQGQKVTAAQFDITWLGRSAEFYSHFGFMEDADLNGSAEGTPRESWTYYSAEGVYRFSPILYGAVRFSGAKANELASIDSSGLIYRTQVGAGLWLSKNLLLKAEYVHQGCNDFVESEGSVGSVDAWRDPSFNGLISEVAFAF
jgi:hypothetical protein